MALTMRELVAARSAEMGERRLEKKRKKMRRGLAPPPPPITLPPKGGTLVDHIESTADVVLTDEVWVGVCMANFYAWIKLQNRNQRNPEKARRQWLRQQGLTWADIKHLFTDTFELHGPAHVIKPVTLPSGRVIRRGRIGYVTTVPTKAEPRPQVVFKFKGPDGDYVREKHHAEIDSVEPVQSALAWGWRPSVDLDSDSDTDD